MVIVGTIKGEVIAFDLAGKQKWVANVGGEVLAPVVISGKTGVVRTGDGRIYALALADGKRQWVYQRPTRRCSCARETSVIVTPTTRWRLSGRQAHRPRPGRREAHVGGDREPAARSTELERVADVAGLPVIEAGRICADGVPGQGGVLRHPGRQTRSGRGTTPAPRGSRSTTRAPISPTTRQRAPRSTATPAPRAGGRTSCLRRSSPRPSSSTARSWWATRWGTCHVLSKDDGALIGRIEVDGGAVNAMVRADGGLLVQTAGGTVFLHSDLRRAPRGGGGGPWK